MLKSIPWRAMLSFVLAAILIAPLALVNKSQYITPAQAGELAVVTYVAQERAQAAARAERKQMEIKHLAKQAVRAIGLPVKPGTTYAGLSKEQAHAAAAIHSVFGERLFPRAVQIAWCESRLSPTATNTNRNGTKDHGLFQINDGGTLQGTGLKKSEALDPLMNAKAARKLHRDRGWQPWVCRSKI